MLPAQELPLVRGRELDYRDLPSLAGWYPVTLNHQAPRPTLWWRFMGGRRFTEAFFQDSLALQPSAERQVCQTALTVLDDPAHGFGNSLPPTAFIFHVSRCGSTLLTQLLAAQPGCIVLSEPPVLDAFFRLHHARPDHSGGARMLQRLVAALAQRRQPTEQHCVLKLDSWHMPWMPWLRQAFPNTPFVLLYREPDEVLASHRRQRGQHMVPGLVDLSLLQAGMAPGDGGPADLEGHGARVLAAIFQSALAAVTGPSPLPGVTLVNYRQLPELTWTTLLPAWSIPCAGAALAAMQARTRQHAKHADRPFEGDAAAVAPPPRNAQALGSHTEALRCYAALEALRLAAAEASVGA